MSLKSRITKKYKDGTLSEATFFELSKEFGMVTESDKRLLRAVLSELKKENFLYLDRGVYKLSKQEKFKSAAAQENAEIIEGVFNANERGFGFIFTDNGDYYVSRENAGYALSGDKVSAAVIYGAHGKRDAAVILKIIGHTLTNFSGTFFKEGAFSYMRPDDKNYLADIQITNLNGYEPAVGDKVYVRVTAFPAKSCPHGEIVAVLGRRYELLPEENSLLLTYGFYEDFSPAVKNEAAKLSSKIADNGLIGRLDLTDKVVFTIDGEDARDFDDAVSIELTPEGNYYLGVHIADVTEFVSYGSAIDNEAFKRGTSGYFPDRVVPMLPFELSNELCSLKEGEQRLTVSVFATIDSCGNILDSKFYKSYIKSTYRMTYNEVQAIFDGDKQLKDKYFKAVDSLYRMLELKNILEAKRRECGYIDLDIKEGDIVYDGEKITVGLHKQNDATKLIEQFMITANELVAEYLYYLSLPCIYRVHGKPDKEKTAVLKELLSVLGLSVRWKRDEVYPSDYQKLIDSVKESDKFSVVNRAVLRSLKKAAYSTENIGHFGLASKCYCHFTSPIRRYPDLVVHRILKAALDGDIGTITDLYEDFLPSAAENSTRREKLADEAERAIDDLYKVKYLENYIDCEFGGVISGVTARGVYVELENTCEGFIPIEFLPGTYELDSSRLALVGKKRSYKIGDRMDIIVVGADIGERKAEFLPAFYKSDLQKLKKYGRM